MEHLAQAALQSKAVLLVPEDPCCFPASPCQVRQAEVTSRLRMNVISPSPGLLVTAHSSGSFSPRKPPAAQEARAWVMLENFTFLPGVEQLELLSPGAGAISL